MNNLFQKLMLGGSTVALVTAMSIAGAQAQLPTKAVGICVL